MREIDHTNRHERSKTGLPEGIPRGAQLQNGAHQCATSARLIRNGVLRNGESRSELTRRNRKIKTPSFYRGLTKASTNG
jgi:hypothetical protein